MRALGRRLPGYGASALSRATGSGFAVSPVDVTRSSSPLPRQEQRIGRDRQRRRCYPQVGDNLWITQDPGRGSPSQASLGPSQRRGFGRSAAGEPAHRWKAPRVRLIPLFFAEERVTRPLAPGGVRVIRAGVSLWLSGPAASRKQVIGGTRARPFAGVRGVWRDRERRMPRWVSGKASPATSESPADEASISRQEVSERIGLG